MAEGSHSRPTSRTPRLVLVGGGHAHVQVLRRFALGPKPAHPPTLVVDTRFALYSGMVPGFIAGQYRLEELQIDVVDLAHRAGAEAVVAKAVGVDPGRRLIRLEDGSDIPYNIASFDIGSTVAGLDLPGIREHSVPTRPIGAFGKRVGGIIERARSQGPDSTFHVVVVGGGAGGVELAFTLHQRLHDEGRAGVQTLLVQNGPRILPGYPDSLVARVRRRAEARGIDILLDRKVTAAGPEDVTLDNGERVPCQALIWVTGSVSQPIFKESGLPTDERGFVRVRSTLQVEGHDELFAAGDCATLTDHPTTPKAGVYAVRQGPVITNNLLASLTGQRLRAYRPQKDFLTLLNLGGGLAAGSKWNVSFEGAWVMALKDWIDRRFVRRFQTADRPASQTAA